MYWTLHFRYMHQVSGKVALEDHDVMKIVVTMDPSDDSPDQRAAQISAKLEEEMNRVRQDIEKEHCAQNIKLLRCEPLT